MRDNFDGVLGAIWDNEDAVAVVSVSSGMSSNQDSVSADSLIMHDYD